MGGGGSAFTTIGPTKPPPKPQFAFGSPETFSTAVGQQAGDYDKIMGEYEKLIRAGESPGANSGTPVGPPQLSTWNESANVTNSLANLGGLSATGGYSGNDIANIRARSISPIRSIYANAQRNLDRNKTLQGGYSPNYNPATAKMAREMSEQLAARTTDVEAGIAQNVAQNKLSIAPSWASASLENDRNRLSVERANQDAVNRVNELNAEIANRRNSENRGQMLGAVEGMRGLYGTTPALVNTFGNQVSQATQHDQNQQQIDAQKRRDEENAKNERLRAAMPMYG